jgi:hypothetical protein
MLLCIGACSGGKDPGPPDPTVPGWLGNRSTGAIAGFACYSDNKLLASWLPSEQTARDWQAMVGGAGLVTSCN